MNRFAVDTRHMIIFDVLTDDSPIGWKGERTRVYLTEEGYQKALERQKDGHIKILSHAKVFQGICAMTVPTSCVERSLL